MKVPDGWIVEVKRIDVFGKVKWEYRFRSEDRDLPIWFGGNFSDTREGAIDNAATAIDNLINNPAKVYEWERA